MTPLEICLWYVIYAFVQALLIARFGIKEKEHPVGCVVAFMVIAPLTTLTILAWCVWAIITILVTGRLR